MPNLFSIVGMDFIQMSIIHENTCRVVHKKCYQENLPGSYCGDSKWEEPLASYR